MTIKVSRLYRKDSGVFYLRIKVPAELKAVLGKGEIHRSLGTKDPILARSLALGANSALELQRQHREASRRRAATPDGVTQIRRVLAELAGMPCTPFMPARPDGGGLQLEPDRLGSNGKAPRQPTMPPLVRFESQDRSSPPTPRPPHPMSLRDAVDPYIRNREGSGFLVERTVIERRHFLETLVVQMKPSSSPAACGQGGPWTAREGSQPDSILTAWPGFPWRAAPSNTSATPARNALLGSGTPIWNARLEAVFTQGP